MELRDAFDQIATIRNHLAAADRLRGLRAVPVAVSGGLALLAAAAQSLWIQEPLREPGRYLLLWVGAAAISALALGLELLRRTRDAGSSLGIANALLAVRQFAPSLFAGAAVTAIVAARLPEQLWLLPGLWQVLFGLGILAAHRLLPTAAFAIGTSYLLCGSLLPWLGTTAVHPAAMGLPFACGQATLAYALWRQQEQTLAEAQP